MSTLHSSEGAKEVTVSNANILEHGAKILMIVSRFKNRKNFNYFV